MQPHKLHSVLTATQAKNPKVQGVLICSNYSLLPQSTTLPTNCTLRVCTSGDVRPGTYWVTNCTQTGKPIIYKLHGVNYGNPNQY